MSVSKAWNWSEEHSAIWREPSEESYFIAQRWQQQGRKAVLDFGCGLGRHAIYFARQGFTVSAFDLSQEGVDTLAAWAHAEGVAVETQVCDMLALP